MLWCFRAGNSLSCAKCLQTFFNTAIFVQCEHLIAGSNCVPDPMFQDSFLTLSSVLIVSLCSQELIRELSTPISVFHLSLENSLMTLQECTSVFSRVQWKCKELSWSPYLTALTGQQSTRSDLWLSSLFPSAAGWGNAELPESGQNLTVFQKRLFLMVTVFIEVRTEMPQEPDRIVRNLQNKSLAFFFFKSR